MTIEVNFPDIEETATGKIRPLNTADNLKALLRANKIKAMLNLMTLETEIFFQDQQTKLTDEGRRSFLISLAAKSGLAKSTIEDHLIAVAESAPYHPFANYLDSSWDGIPRVESALSSLNAKFPELANTVLTTWLVGVVASIYEDNFKSKLVPILQGPQSAKKSAFIERIANVFEGAFLEGAELNPDNKDSVLSCIRSLAVELGELERSTKNNQGSLKAFLSKGVDTVRPPYAKSDIKKIRQTHFIATVNGTDFLKDETGSSRFAVIELASSVDIESLNTKLGWQYDSAGSLKLSNPQLLKQFWLEVKHLYLQKHSWHLSQEALTQMVSINSKHSDKGEWYGVLEDKFFSSTSENRHVLPLTSTRICELIGESTKNNRAIGKALMMLVKEKRLKSVKRGNVNHYYVPVPMNIKA
ncbi:hypothetical protein AHAT_41590 [Agarivorans sp. Toyoura001]|uniref:VapE domain-containing protein n=1 Tax=Agarivorans sp. Toyoura001 TaxID=2283141 RepID=UPI0010E306E2|nr:VapE domain-containing protein [Agarivorans sp. Toyoura001]GDY28269.1 hypothetical protein AHAT_41590 [Agarivorans sp. Toyoura001]